MISPVNGQPLLRSGPHKTWLIFKWVALSKKFKVIFHWKFIKQSYYVQATTLEIGNIFFGVCGGCHHQKKIFSINSFETLFSLGNKAGHSETLRVVVSPWLIYRICCFWFEFKKNKTKQKTFAFYHFSLTKLEPLQETFVKLWVREKINK